MRPLRVSLAVAVMLALLGGIGATVVAQDGATAQVEPVESPAETGAVGEAVVWHRLNPSGPEHERLTCSDTEGTLSCDYDKVEEVDFAWDAGTARFSGDDVTPSWACPDWFPALVCDGAVSVWSGTMRYLPVEGEAAEVPQVLVVTDEDGQPQLWLQFTDWALACPWYGTIEEALAANPDYLVDCASEG